MAVLRRRYLFWLIKAYLKKWGKIIIFSFFIGLTIFFLLLRISPMILRFIPLEKKVVVGMTGPVTIETIPTEIVDKLSRGLTKVEKDGVVKPDLASSWDIEENGKTYIFYLRKDVSFSDGTSFTTKDITYQFSDVQISKPDDYTIIFTLKDAYAPFPVTVAKPILRRGYIGTGEYKINNIELNGTFIRSLQLVSTKNRFKIENYIFYDTNEALKVAFAMGELTRAVGLTDASVKNANLTTFPNVTSERIINDKRLVTLFFNTEDSVISDKKLRNSLTYALPDTFSDGQRVHHPYAPSTWYYNTELTRSQDFDHAKLLLTSSIESASASAQPELTVKTLAKYKKTAEEIADAWEKIGVTLTIEEVTKVPEEFQLYLGDFNLPRDPDQYTIWHSGQSNNITKLKNLRIDKLLEDGRKTPNQEERLKIYLDFQKYLLDESPAAFLYIPYEFELIRT